MRTRLVLVGLLLVGCQAPPPPDTASAPPVAVDPAQTEREIREVVEGFDAALAAGDSTRALSLLHPEAVVYEGGHAETLEQYRTGHLGADIQFSRSVQRQTTRDQVVPGDSLALYLSEYTASGRFRDRDVDVQGAETMVLARTPEGWRIRHIHWSSH